MSLSRRAVGGALCAIAEALEIASGCSGEEAPSRPAWLAIALVQAVQGACTLALSAYETSDPADILAPTGSGRETDGKAEPGQAADPPRIAPLALLLRRVRSPDCLDASDRPQLPASARRDLLALAAYRNRVMHRLPWDDPHPPDSFPGCVMAACELLDALLVGRPAFDAAPHGGVLAAISTQLSAIRRMAGEGGARFG